MQEVGVHPHQSWAMYFSNVYASYLACVPRRTFAFVRMFIVPVRAHLCMATRDEMQ